MAAANEENLEQRIVNVFRSEITVEKLVWEVVPDYFIYKLPNLKIISCSIKTNNEGNKIDFSFFVIDYISFTAIANIFEVFDVIVKSCSDKWSPCSYSTQIIAQIVETKPLIKYTLTTINSSTQDLADKNVVHLKNL